VCHIWHIIGGCGSLGIFYHDDVMQARACNRAPLKKRLESNKEIHNLGWSKTRVLFWWITATMSVMQHDWVRGKATI
jgi:hypothetical protein